jgi:hypothetical protein
MDLFVQEENKESSKVFETLQEENITSKVSLLPLSLIVMLLIFFISFFVSCALERTPTTRKNLSCSST